MNENKKNRRDVHCNGNTHNDVFHILKSFDIYELQVDYYVEAIEIERNELCSMWIRLYDSRIGFVDS